VGCVNGGWIGCGVGLTAGTIDVVAQYYGLYDRAYLTAGVLGYGALSVFRTPQVLLNAFTFEMPATAEAQAINFALSSVVDFTFSSVRNVVAFTAGMTMATGRLTPYFEYVAAPSQGTIYGYACGGLIGAAGGMTAGVIDEYASRSNVTHSYWLSGSMIYGAAVSSLVWPIITGALMLTPVRGVTKFLPTSKIVHAAIGAVAGLGYQSWQNNTEPQRWKPFVLQEELYDLYSTIIPKHELDSLMRNIAITTVAAQLSTQRLFTLLLERRQGMNTQFFVQLGGYAQEPNVWDKYLKSFGIVVFALLVPSTVGLCLDDLIKAYANTKITYKTIDETVARLFAGETMLKLERLYGANGTSSNTLIKNMYKDIDKVTEGAVLLLGGATSETQLGKASAIPAVIRGYYSGGFLISVNAVDLIIYNFIFDAFTGFITRILADNQHKGSDRIVDLVAQGETILEHGRVNVLALVQESSMSFIHEMYMDMCSEYRTLKGGQTIFLTLMNAWKNLKGWGSFLYNHMVIFKKVLEASMVLVGATPALLLTDDIIELISWENNNAAQLISIKLAMQRLRELIVRLEESDDSSAVGKAIDYGDGHVVVRTYKQGLQPKLCLNDFSVGIRNTPITLTSAEHVCVSGPIVAVTGGSGGGKSTTLQIIQGIRYAGSWGNGEITFVTKTGQTPVIMAVGQEPAITPYVTYLEHMTRRLGVQARVYEARVRELMNEFKVDVGANTTLANALNEPTHSVVLSGGQKKKVALISAVIKTFTSEGVPDVVILDETLAGLDPLSLDLAKKAIQTYWGTSALVLVVDHNANGVTGPAEGFYHSNLYFNNFTRVIEAHQWRSQELMPTTDLCHEVQATGVC
jgi:ABC-type nitrate/sulfonate/bicarbonate transport system ATPase subunit